LVDVNYGWGDIVRYIYISTTIALKAKVVVELGTGVGHSTESDRFKIDGWNSLQYRFIP